METYEIPEVLVSYSVQELAEEAAVCTGGYEYEPIPTETA
jgi:hypothetical protein